MIRKIDIIIPTLGKPHFIEAIKSLRHVPFNYDLHVITEGESWAEAVNIGLARSSNDVLLMDDDITLLPDTFKDFERLPEADIIGFKLLFPDGAIQHAGGFTRHQMISHLGWKYPDSGEFDFAYRVCHCTASLLLIKRRVIDALGCFQILPGVQFEDVDFSFRAIKEGFEIVYVPNAAIHHESQSKGDNPDFRQNMNKAFAYIHQTYLTGDFRKELETYPREL